jgi:hypothetical protein
MKNLRNFCATTALILTLTASAFAGIMDTGVAAPVPTPIQVVTSSTTHPPASTTGNMSTGVTSTDPTTDGTTTAGSLTETLLSLLQGIWGLI